MGFRPVTIGDLRRKGKLLELGCMGCARHLYDPANLPLPDALPVPETAARLACSQCGAINQPTWHPIWARPDARVWPATSTDDWCGEWLAAAGGV